MCGSRRLEAIIYNLLLGQMDGIIIIIMGRFGGQI